MAIVNLSETSARILVFGWLKYFLTSNLVIFGSSFNRLHKVARGVEELE
jgi:hypothetical protein